MCRSINLTDDEGKVSFMITDNNSTACLFDSAAVDFLLALGCGKKDKRL